MLSSMIIMILLVVIFFIVFNRAEIVNQAIICSGIIFMISVLIWMLFDKSTVQPQFVENMNYLNIFGVDGISLFFMMLTTLLIFLCIIDTWNSNIINNKEYIIYFLILEIFLIISFSTLDLLVFYIFFESVLIPMFLIMGIWGSSERSMRADFYFFLYTLLGSVLMLFCILVLFFEVYSTNFLLLQNTFFSMEKEYLLWFFSFIAFSVKIPMFPFHLWLPEAHVESPTGGSVILAGLLLKLGGYGYIRVVLPLFSYASFYFFPLVAIFCIISMIYTSLITIRQIDLKSMIAYSSVAHMNVVLLGMFCCNIHGLQGSLFLMLAHGIVSAGLFFMMGNLYKRCGTSLLYYYGGLSSRMPLFSMYLFIFCLANSATPGSCNFIGELLVFLSLIHKNFFIVILSASSVILSVIYSMWFFNRIVFGNLKIEYMKNWSDIDKKENFMYFMLIFLTILFGIFPNLLLDYTNTSSNYMMELMKFKLSLL